MLDPEEGEADEDPLEGVVVVDLPLLGAAAGGVVVLLPFIVSTSDFRQPAPPTQSPAAIIEPTNVSLSFCAFISIIFEG